jgi:hypothetical protein
MRGKRAFVLGAVVGAAALYAFTELAVDEERIECARCGHMICENALRFFSAENALAPETSDS